MSPTVIKHLERIKTKQEIGKKTLKICLRVFLFFDRNMRFSFIKFLSIRSIRSPSLQRTRHQNEWKKKKASTIVRLGPVKLPCPSLPSKRCIGPRHQKKVVSKNQDIKRKKSLTH